MLNNELEQIKLNNAKIVNEYEEENRNKTFQNNKIMGEQIDEKEQE